MGTQGIGHPYSSAEVDPQLGRKIQEGKYYFNIDLNIAHRYLFC